MTPNPGGRGAGTTGSVPISDLGVGGGGPRCPWGQEPSPRGSHGGEPGGRSLCPPSSALSPPLGDTGEMETGVGDTVILLHGTGVTSVHLTTTSLLTLSPHPYFLFMSRYKTKISSTRGAGAAEGLPGPRSARVGSSDLGCASEKRALSFPSPGHASPGGRAGCPGPAAAERALGSAPQWEFCLICDLVWVT